MVRISSSDMNRALYLLARKFQSAKQKDEVTGCGGWGQFIDASPGRFQIGTYGTVSGTVVTVEGLGERSVPYDVRQFLHEIWLNEQNGVQVAGRRFSQNLKLFIYFLGLSKLGDEDSELICKELKKQLLLRQLDSGLWGDWWIDEMDHDVVPKIFPSSVAIICLYHSGEFSESELERSANQLIELISYASDVPEAYLGIALAAIGSVISRDDNLNIYKKLKKIVWADKGEVQTESLYIYEYKYLNEEEEKKWDTEIFTFPSSILIGIAALKFENEPVFNVFCFNIANKIVEIVIAHDGLLPSDAEMRTHCMPQMWCSLYLSQYRAQLWSPTFIHKFLFRSFSPHSQSAFWYKVFPLVVVLTVTMANVIFSTSTIGIEWRVAISGLTVVVAGVWGPDVVRRWLPGGR